MEAAIHVRPFGFDRVFHVPGSEPAPPDSRGMADQIEALHARIRAMDEDHRTEIARVERASFEAGLTQARLERDGALLVATDAIHAAIEQIDARLADAIEAMMGDGAEAALAAAEMLAGHAIDQAPARAIEEALGRVLHQVSRGTRISVRAHPAFVEPIERVLAERSGRDRRKLLITVIADEDVQPGDAVIFWDEGGLAVDAAARRAAVLAELAPMLRGAGAE